MRHSRNWTIAGCVLLLLAAMTFSLGRTGHATPGSGSGIRLEAPEKVVISIRSIPLRLSVLHFADIDTYRILKQLHMGLLTSSFRGDLFSGVARSWQVSHDRLVYDFNLDLGLKFHSGRELQCEDVRASVANAIETLPGSPIFSLIDDHGCLNPSVYRMRLRRASAQFLAGLAHMESSILPRETLKSADTLVGLGPYRVSSRDSESMVLERVEGHPLAHAWSPMSLKFVAQPLPESAIGAFDKGELDIVALYGGTANEHPRLVDSNVFFSRVWFVSFGNRLKGAGFSSSEIKCISDAIDRAKLIESIGSAARLYAPAYGVVAPYQPGYFEWEEAARDRSASCSRPKRIDLLVITEMAKEEFVGEIRRQLAAVGLEVSITRLSKKEAIGRIVSRDYEAAFFSMGISTQPEYTLYNFYSHTSPFSISGVQNSAFKPELEFIERSRSQSSRNNRIFRLQETLHRSPSFIPLMFERTTYLLSKCLWMGNFSIYSGTEDFKEVGQVHGCQR